MEMEYAPAPTVLFFPPPFPPPSPEAIDVSSLEFILVLLAVIPIAAIIYAFFFTTKCPRRRSSGISFSHGSGPRGGAGGEDAVSELSVTKDAAADAHIGGECPVCLSTFAEGEDIRQLSACKHAFHAACIDAWLSSHSNCPICRAVVGGKTPSSNSSTATAAWGGAEDAEHHQGLPDASFLV